VRAATLLPVGMARNGVKPARVTGNSISRDKFGSEAAPATMFRGRDEHAEFPRTSCDVGGPLCRGFEGAAVPAEIRIGRV
jgi:hypothetical protein